MHSLLDRLNVLMGTAVTYLVLAAVAISGLASEIAAAAPDGGELVTEWLLLVATWITAAVAVVRRVTPVPENKRGLLP